MLFEKSGLSLKSSLLSNHPKRPALIVWRGAHHR
jgi:hypothetical protein